MDNGTIGGDAEPVAEYIQMITEQGRTMKFIRNATKSKRSAVDFNLACLQGTVIEIEMYFSRRMALLVK